MPDTAPAAAPSDQFSIPWDQLFGPSELTTSSIQDLPDWLKPYATGLLSRADALSNTPYPYPDQRVAAMTPGQLAGQANTFGAAEGSWPMIGAANTLGMNTLQGAYLSPETNPFLEETYNKASRGVVDQYKNATAPQTAANFNRAGTFGGSAQQQQEGFDRYGMGENLSSLANQIYGGNYQTERQRQYGQQSYTPGILNQQYIGPNAEMAVGAAQQGQAQNVLNANYQNTYNRANWPYQAYNIAQGAYGAVAPGAGGSTTTTGPNPNATSPFAMLLGLNTIANNGGGGFGGAAPFPGAAAGFGNNFGFGA